MQSKQIGQYPDNWKTIALKVKEEAGWKCVRCGHVNDAKAGYMLTVHHLDGNKSNCEWWNIVPLCQRCHLSIQARVVMERAWLLPHSEWFKIYVAGYYAHRFGLPSERDHVAANIDYLIALGQGQADAEGR